MCIRFENYTLKFIVVYFFVGVLQAESLILDSHIVKSVGCSTLYYNKKIATKKLINYIVKNKQTTCLKEVNCLYNCQDCDESMASMYVALLSKLFLNKENELAKKVIKLMPQKIVNKPSMYGVFSLIENIHVWKALYDKGFNPYRKGYGKTFFEFMLAHNKIRVLKLSLIVAYEKCIFPENIRYFSRFLNQKAHEINGILGLIND